MLHIKYSRNLKGVRGFTLIEMLAVIAIFGLLLALMLPATRTTTQPTATTRGAKIPTLLEGGQLRNQQLAAPENLHFVALTGDDSDGVLVELATRFNFYIDSEGVFENAFGAGEKWVRSDSSNTFGNPWYYILPSGRFFEWSGNGLSGNLLAELNVNAHHNPELLVGASNQLADDVAALVLADNERHFYRSSDGNFFFNVFGLRERWFKGQRDRKSTANQGNPWYFIVPDGTVFEWDGNPNSPSGVTVGNFGAATYRNPMTLINANAIFGAGDISAIADFDLFFDRSDGLIHNLYEDFSQSDLKWFRGTDPTNTGNAFYFIRTNGAVHKWNGTNTQTSPVVANLNADFAWDNLDAVVNQNATLQTNEAIELDQERALYRASNDSDFFFNALGAQEKWLLGDPSAKSASGQNNPWYIIVPGGMVMEWDGSSTATGTVVGAFGDEVYRNPNVLGDAYADGSALSGPKPDTFFPNDDTAPGDRLCM